MENSIEWWIDNRKISIEIYSISTENGIQFGSYSPTMGLMQNYVNLYHK